MGLRPNTLQVVSSTQIEIGFNKKLSNFINIDNFEIISSIGLNDSIKILNVLVIEKNIIITTSPQISGNLYTISLKDSDSLMFKSDDGDLLVNDDVSRVIYFVGSDSYNPIRDSMVLNIPKIYNLDGSNIRNIISSQAEEIYQLEKHIGEVLSDNYISSRVEDELRIRGSGAKDRLANENAFSIESVSMFPSGQNLLFGQLFFNNSSKILSQKKFESIPISLQQSYYEEEYLFSNFESKLSGYLLNLKKSNILKLESFKIIKNHDDNCNRQEIIYNIDNLFYSIKNNKYDPNRSFSFDQLETNQILLSSLFDISNLSVNDKIFVSYLYKDLSIKINENSIVVYDIKNVLSEQIPQESVRFFLKNAPLTNQLGSSGSIGDSEFIGDGQAFLYEIPYNASRLPSNFGEYSVNYETGEVILYGDRNIFGTSGDNYFCNYFYKKIYIKNLDYSVNNNDIIPVSNRSLSNSNAIVTFNYQQQFVDGVDYKSEIHSEVLNEQVESNLLSTFSLKTKLSPITRVFSIFNQTTGETYQPVSFYKNEITFSSINPPKIVQKKSNKANFDRVQSEKIQPYSRILNSIFKFKVININSINSIDIYPPIPSILIDESETSYMLKDTNNNVKNMIIKFFGEKDINGNIGRISLTTNSDLPDINKEYYIGINCILIKLNKESILNASETEIGNFLQSSLVLDENIFKEEKYFYTDNDLYLSTKSFITNNNVNLSTNSVGWLKRPGQYTVDYRGGIIYLATGLTFDIDTGFASYSYSKIINYESNIISCDNIYKKKNIAEKSNLINFNKYKLSNGIVLEDLNDSIDLPNGSKINIEGSDVETGIVTENYIVYTKYTPSNFFGVYNISDFFGNKSQLLSSRSEPSPISELRLGIEFGGRNLYSSDFKIYENSIDLKKYKNFKAINNYDYSFQIKSEFFGSIFKIKNKTLNIEISDQTLDGLKIYTDIYNVIDNGATSFVYIDSNLDINVTSNYLKDSNNKKFTILSYDDISGIIEVENINDGIDYIAPSIGIAKITSDILINDLHSYKEVKIPNECLIRNGDDVEICYTNSYTPLPYSRVITVYSSGNIFYDSTETSDNLVVSYEYGDNEINWQISNALAEGERYYVTYRYGALRDALKNNFGILTKIPFFTNFSINTDRELYRKALQGVMESFVRGPTLSSFENIIEKFTEQSPEVKESFFGSWILGRDFLSHKEIDYSGELKFEAAKFDSGILVNGNTVITTPSKTSLNVDEGTFSCWVRNDWYGINNDADVYFDFSSMSKIKFNLILNSDIFKEQNFELFMSNDRHGYTNWSGDKVSIYNYHNIGDSELVGPYGITKYTDRLNSSRWSRHSFSISASPSGTITALPDFFKFDPGSISSRLSTFGMHGMIGGSITSSRGSIGDGLEIFLDYYCSPFSISIGDGSKVALVYGVLNPVKNNETGRVLALKIEDSNIENNDIPNYDGPFIIKNCNCIDYDDLESLVKFSNNELLLSKVIFDDPINIGYLNNIYNIISSKITGCKFITNDGRIYPILYFVDSNGKTTNFIPNDGMIYGFITTRVAENKQYITSYGSESIRLSSPSGTGIITIPSLNVLREEFNSEIVFENTYKPILVDFTSNSVNIDIYRDPSQNKLDISINDYSFNLLYSDLISINNFNNIFEILNLNSWFNNEYGGINNIDNIQDLNTKLFIGSLDPIVKSQVLISKMTYTIQESLSTSDIYIGPNGKHPNSLKFTLNRKKDNLVGSPEIFDDKKSLYIWIDDSHRIDDNMVGSWKLKSVIPNQSAIPLDVDGYTTIYNFFEFNDYIEGRIKTDCGFSYANTANTDDYLSPKNYRFCGQSKLESGGWKYIGDYGSDLINTIIGGTEHNTNSWIKYGDFNSNIISNIYRVSNILNESYLFLPIEKINNLTYNISFKIIEYDTSIVGSASGSFSGSISGNLIGLTLLEIFDEQKSIKICLAANNLYKYIVILDGISSDILDIIEFNWMNNEFNEIQIKLEKEKNIITIYNKLNIISRITYSLLNNYEFNCNNILQPGIYLRFNDKKITSSDFINEFNQIIIDIDYIELELKSSVYQADVESNDYINIQNNVIDLKLFNKSDGYLDSYGYYEDGSDTDTIVFVADCDKYIFDSGELENKNRMSIYKDYNGYLNFKIYDSIYKNGYYSISTNVKYFSPGEFHHISASWRLNSPYNMDEMHLFIDGKEVPSLYKFGGDISPLSNSKVGSIAKNVIQNFAETKIVFGNTISDGQILAGEDYIVSASAGFSQSDIGMSIIISDGGLASQLNGVALVIASVDGDVARLLDISTMMPYVFNTSSNNVKFYRPPRVAGSHFDIDFTTSKFEIYRKSCSSITEELGGTLYKIEDNSIVIINNNVINPKYRINLNTGSVEFLENKLDCIWSPSVNISDLEIWIEIFGLNKTNINEKISYTSTRDVDLYNITGFITNLPKPIKLESVSIKRILLDRFIPDGEVDLNVFSFQLEQDIFVSSEFNTPNSGRLISLNFDSDNIDYCKDGYTIESNYITIEGETTSGFLSETININENKNYNFKNYFTKITKIYGQFNIIDLSYEAFVISLFETDSISTQNNSGEYAEVYGYSNGVFTIATYGTNGQVNYNLPSGIYEFDYPSFLNIKLPNVGDSIYIGTDLNGKRPFDGLIDEVKITTECSSDTRDYQSQSTSNKSITEEFLTNKKSCLSNQTIFLSHFDDPFNIQIRRLRNKLFLNEKENFKFKLNKKELETLSKFLNNKEKFISAMINMGFKKDISEQTYIETHMAGGGPLFNESRYSNNYELLSGSESVNENFGSSGKFFNSNTVVFRSTTLFSNINTIEFWISPLLSTDTDISRRVIFETTNIKKLFVQPLKTNIIDLPFSIQKVVSITLPEKKDFNKYSTTLYDDVLISDLSGKLEGGTGTLNNFAKESLLLNNGTRVLLKTNLPSNNNIVLSYIDKNSADSKLTMFIENNKLYFNINNLNEKYEVYYDIKWNSNSWNKVSISWKSNTGNDFIKLSVNGSTTETSTYKGVLNINDNIDNIYIGSSYDGFNSCISRIDNFRVSNIDRLKTIDLSGNYIDFNYSKNTNTVKPLLNDSNTTYLNDFELFNKNKNYITLVDPIRGIYNFDINIIDDFNKINSEEIEDLIINLINKLKPSHTNVLVNFKRKTC
jgi:hypothetical protein